PVHDHAAEGQAALAQAAVEEDRLVDRVALRRGDDEEGGTAVGEQLVDAAGALLEALGHVAEALEEVGQVLEQVDPRDPLQRREHEPAAAAEQLEARSA